MPETPPVARFTRARENQSRQYLFFIKSSHSVLECPRYQFYSTTHTTPSPYPPGHHSLHNNLLSQSLILVETNPRHPSTLYHTWSPLVLVGLYSARSNYDHHHIPSTLPYLAITVIIHPSRKTDLSYYVALLLYFRRVPFHHPHFPPTQLLPGQNGDSSVCLTEHSLSLRLTAVLCQ